jgi:small subunit ribosomal protein S7
MPRRKYKRIEQNRVDPKYNDPIIASTITNVLRRGKKSLAESLMYEALDLVQKKSGGRDPQEVFAQAIRNVSPTIMVKSRRVGGATYQVPIEVRQDRRLATAIRWLLQYSRDRKGKSFPERFSDEIVEAADNKGGAVKKKLDTHKMAEANKAFSHYRF